MVVALRPHAVGVVHARRVVAHVAAAVRGDDLQPRVALQHAAEDDVRERDRGVERIADDVGEEVLRETPRLGESARVQEDDGPERLGPGPEPVKALVAEIDAANVGADLQPAETQSLHAVFQFGQCEFRRLHRHGSERDETVGV